MKHLLHLSAGFILFTNGVCQAQQRIVRSALPSVTTGGSVWVDRGQQMERVELRKELERKEEALRQSRSAQTALIAELERTQAHLLKTRESDRDQAAVQKELSATHAHLQALRFELETMEVAAISQERSYQLQLERATASHAALKEKITLTSNQLITTKDALKDRGADIEALKDEIRTAQSERDKQQRTLHALQKKLSEKSPNAEAMAKLKATHEKELATLRAVQNQPQLPRDQVQKLIEQNERLANDNKKLTLQQDALLSEAARRHQKELDQKMAEAEAAYKRETEKRLVELQANKIDDRQVKALLKENTELVAENKRLKVSQQQVANEKPAQVEETETANRSRRQEQIRELIEQNARLTQENRRLTNNLETVALAGPNSDRLKTALDQARAEHAQNRSDLERQLKADGLASDQVKRLIDENIKLTKMNNTLIEENQRAAEKEKALTEARRIQNQTLEQLEQELEIRSQKEAEIKLLQKQNVELSAENKRLLQSKDVNIQGINARLQQQKKLADQRTREATELKSRLDEELKEVARLESIVQADAKEQESRGEALIQVESRIKALQTRITLMQKTRENPNAPVEKIIELQAAIDEEKILRSKTEREFSRVNDILEGNKRLVDTQKIELSRLQGDMSKMDNSLRAESNMVALLKGELQKAVEEKQQLKAQLENRANQPDPKAAEATRQLAQRIAELESSLKENDTTLASLRDKLQAEQARSVALSKSTTKSELLLKQLAETEQLVKEREQALDAEKKRAVQIETLKKSVDTELLALKKELGAEKKRREELEQLAKKHKNLKNEIEDLNQFLSTTQEANQIQLEDMTAVSVERDSLKKLIADYENTINVQEKEITDKQYLAHTIATTEGDPKAQVNTIKALNEKLTRHQGLLDKMQLEKAEVEKRLIDREGELARKQSALNALEKEFVKIKQQPTEKPKYTASVNSLREKLKEKETTLLALQREISSLETQQTAGGSSQPVDRKIKSLADERDRLVRTMAERDKVIEDLRAALKSKEDEAKRLKARQSKVAKPTTSGRTNPPSNPAAAKPTVTKPNETAGTGTPGDTKKTPAAPPEVSVKLPPLAPAKPGNTDDPDATAKDRALVAKEIASQAGRKLQEGKVDEAITEFRRSLKYFPDNSGAKLGLATALYTQGSLPECALLVDEALEKNPMNAQALGLKSIIARHRGDYPKARQIIDTAIALKPDDAMLLNYLGIIANSQTKRDESIAAFKRAVEVDPLHAEARFNLAVLLATGNDAQIQEAIKHYEAAQTLGSERDERLEQILYR